MPKVVPILNDKKAARRAWAVTLLAAVGSPAALNAWKRASTWSPTTRSATPCSSRLKPHEPPPDAR